MWHQTTHLAESLTDLSKQSRCFSPVVAALEGLPFATREASPGLGTRRRVVLLCKAPADSVLQLGSWADRFNTKLIGIQRTLLETLKDKQRELVQTEASEANFAWVLLHMCWYSSRQF